ncbi:MAG: roadblock/LC7 domain-containing protein [Methanoregulaceae archaeon]|jgi:predicted regulator of Ras-like GTPase activity (Roadblock/LC7/MglB family)|nr:roadblock/LC7 domain-containing protein [Methanoregulaceae archaeon]
MILPRGTLVGVLQGPLHGEAVRLIQTFSGVIRIRAEDGRGVILTEQGRVIAACFEGEEGRAAGKEAFDRMKHPLAFFEGKKQEITLFRYHVVEYQEALTLCASEKLLVPADCRVFITAPPPRPIEGKLNNILRQPGVLAVSAFFEGFPVQSFGNADFEQVAATAEDLLRAGNKMIANMGIGTLEQMLLETTEGKFIIAPFGDLFLCLYTTPEANLGLIRLALHSLHQEAA